MSVIGAQPMTSEQIAAANARLRQMTDTERLMYTFDLCADPPGTRKNAKKPKKDHKCPHDNRYTSGMEVCRACGDYRICPVCGMEYIRQDSGDACWMCERVEMLERALTRAKMEQRERAQENGLLTQ